MTGILRMVVQPHQFRGGMRVRPSRVWRASTRLHLGGVMPNRIDLADRIAVVTGGAQGIGRAIVERLLDSGAAVAIWDRDAGQARSTADALASAGEGVV